MSTLCLPSIVVPEHKVTQSQVLDAAPSFLGKHPLKSLLLSMISNTKVEQRFFVQEFEKLFEHPGVEKRNQLYIESAKALSCQAVESALHNAGLKAKDIDMIMVTSCTGFMIPSLDAFLINQFSFNSDIKRIPIAQLGCVAGAASIGRAHDFSKAYPRANILMVAAEFGSLCFQPDDRSMAALVSAMLFGDGVSACVMRGEPGPGLRIDANSSCFLPHTEHFMGFDVRDTGYHMVLDKQVVKAIRHKIAPAITAFLSKEQVTQKELSRYVIHPGGAKVLEELSNAMSISSEALQPSWDSLSSYGNLSSASIFSVLQNHFQTAQHQQKSLLVAFGPGFSIEMSLGKWFS